MLTDATVQTNSLKQDIVLTLSCSCVCTPSDERDVSPVRIMFFWDWFHPNMEDPWIMWIGRSFMDLELWFMGDIIFHLHLTDSQVMPSNLRFIYVWFIYSLEQEKHKQSITTLGSMQHVSQRPGATNKCVHTSSEPIRHIQICSALTGNNIWLCACGSQRVNTAHTSPSLWNVKQF